jgi:hypothetical protein
MDTVATPPLTTFVPRAAIPAAPSVPSEPPTLLDQLVRDPIGCIDRLDRDDAPRLLRSLLGLLFVGAGAFGAVVGAFRGGRQVLYCAIKIPLVLLVTLVVCTPAFVAIARAGEVRLSARQIVSATLAASARFGLVLAGLAPVIWLIEGVVGYHDITLAIVTACAVAGVAAAALLFRALSRGGTAALVGLAFVAVYGVVGTQTAWLLRPFVVRPRTEHVPFVRPIEGDLFEAVRMSARSAAGIYDVSSRRDDARRMPARCEGASCE